MDFKIDENLLNYSYFGKDRKDQHVLLASQQYTGQSSVDFEETRFVHQSLPQMKTDDVDYSTTVAGLDIQTPFFINAMTGGTKETGLINRNLGILGYLAKIPVASGSVSAAIKDPSVAETFTVIRKENPKGIVFANLGAHHDVENAKRAVDLLEANALQIHVNAPQEILMPEGDRDFSHWLTNIETLVREMEVPIIVKEVGFGMSRETVQQLASVGVKTVDISGTGGTDFAKIEDLRRPYDRYPYMHGWGQSTVISLAEAMSLSDQERPEIIASGGIKNPLDIVKALSMGAKMAGLSNHFLQMAKNDKGLEDALANVRIMKSHTKMIMTMLGAKNLEQLRQKDLVLGPSVQNWCQARGIDWQLYANRSQDRSILN
ncbi:isopentenyl pyrophosphate isomerase [Streptococcus varani]|uniref:Isopentenyl-diphosphate delta-isomerase n=1 Tax=Streptococcus varani TaxID=1608583 RepID=A0A0E4CS35_9STRE|nr:type 2 isopentenyl-diphosphate Delta-isomerase [Streptococcus varani]CQR24189.1 isopentenyl pyrophosphate isomerase [Streptococcus varani]